MEIIHRRTDKSSRLSLIPILVFAAVSFSSAKGQAEQPRKAGQDIIDRGKYIVEGVAMCERCHTRRDGQGHPDKENWLMGGPVQTEPTYPAPGWAVTEPRIAGTPPGTDADFIKLLTTGISRTGQPPALPMPPFRMTRQDAEAVLAYLKSLRR